MLLSVAGSVPKASGTRKNPRRTSLLRKVHRRCHQSYDPPREDHISMIS